MDLEVAYFQTNPGTLFRAYLEPSRRSLAEGSICQAMCPVKPRDIPRGSLPGNREKPGETGKPMQIGPRAKSCKMGAPKWMPFGFGGILDLKLRQDFLGKQINHGFCHVRFQNFPSASSITGPQVPRDLGPRPVRCRKLMSLPALVVSKLF